MSNLNLALYNPASFASRWQITLLAKIPVEYPKLLWLGLIALIAFAAAPSTLAQTPPCGISIVRTEGSKIDDRFIPAAPDHVKAAVLKALPVLASKLHKDDGLDIEAKTDQELYMMLARKNEDEGVKRGFFQRGGLGALGTFTVHIEPANHEGVPGSALHIEFHRNHVRGRVGNEKYATPLANEVECLSKALSPFDPSTNPRGPGGAVNGSETKTISLSAGTPIKLTLRSPIYSKKLNKRNPQSVQFEVTDDVTVDGAVVIRKGALATAHFINIQKAKGYGRHAQIEFAFDTATAVDGQAIKLVGASEKSRGGRSNDTVEIVLQSPALGWMFKGNETLIRAGTTYDLEVGESYSVKGGG